MDLYVVRVNSLGRRKKVYIGGDNFEAILKKISTLYNDGDIVDITYDAELNKKFHKGYKPSKLIYA